MKFPFDEKALLYRELAKLSQSGFGLPEAVDAVADTHPPDSSMAVLVGVKAGLAEGKTIGEAFKDLREVQLTDLEVSIIVASEQGGVLEDGFEHLASYFQMRARTSKAMRRKMIYPLVLLHVAIFIPMIPLMIGSDNKLGVVMLSVGALFGAYLVLFVAIVIGRRMAVKAETDPATDAKLARVPLVGPVRKNLALARFTSVYRMHILAGVRIDEGLRSAANASQSGRILQSVEKHAIPGVSNGQPVGPELAKDDHLFTPAFTRGFITAESSGTLDTDLLRWAERFQEAASDSMSKLGEHAPKYFYAFIVLIVLWQIARLVMKIFSGYGEVFKMIDL